MNTKKFILKGCAIVALGLMTTQCDSNKQATTGQVQETTAPSQANTGLKIAYVEVDSLLSKYEFCIEMNQEMVKKEENVRATLNDKHKQLEKEQQEFQYKYENNAFTQARAQEEYERLMKKAQKLEEMKVELAEELAIENQKNNIQLRDSIDAFLKVYNADKHYDFIISNAGYDNLLLANPAYNITQEIVDGLNARYKK